MKVDNLLFKGRIPLYNKALDSYAMRMTTSARNIANVNTVGYKPEAVKFEELFKEQVASLQGATTNERHIPTSLDVNTVPQVNNQQIPVGEIMQSGENDVNLDKEMSILAQTQIRFQFVSSSASKHFKQLGAAITGNTNY
jgi:flagellar basal-body rod protein FlgB